MSVWRDETRGRLSILGEALGDTQFGPGKGMAKEDMTGILKHNVCIGCTLHWQEGRRMKQEAALRGKEQQLQSPAARRW